VCGKAIKGTAREEAGMPCKGKGTGRRKEVEKSRGERSGMRGQTTRSTAKRMEKELVGELEKESRVILWTNSATRYKIVGVGMA